LHWMLTDDGEDCVALVDLSREAVWLLPAVEFRNRAQPLPGGRFHLDWLVWRLSPLLAAGLSAHGMAELREDGSAGFGGDGSGTG